MIYRFKEDQKNIIQQLGFSPEKDYDEDSSEELLDAVADHLMLQGFDEDYKPNRIGDICEDIITILTRQ